MLIDPYNPYGSIHAEESFFLSHGQSENPVALAQLLKQKIHCCDALSEKYCKIIFLFVCF